MKRDFTDPTTVYNWKTLFDANTILKADTDDTPEALTVAEQRIVGRITSGEITALTGAQALTILTAQAAAAFSWNGQNLTGVGSIAMAGALTVGSSGAITGISLSL